MATTSVDPLVHALCGLGFTEIEALVYGFLVKGEPATGYRISHAIGKPTANTYKAIASLLDQGAVLADEGGTRLVRAVPPEELLAGLERRARARREAARDALAEHAGEVVDERVWAIRAADQVLDRARAMLGRARAIVLADLFPAPYEALAPDLSAAAARGVRVVVKACARRDAAGVTEVLEPDAARTLAAWPGQPLTLVCDAEEHLLALLDDGLSEVRQAVWSRSAFLSCLQHNRVAMDLLQTAWKGRGEALVGLSLVSARPPGLARLGVTHLGVRS